MTESEILAKINEVVEPLDEITMDTVILDCDDLDSLSIFNVILAYKDLGISLNLRDVNNCDTVGDLVNFTEERLLSVVIVS